jgi:hypothetical protein
VAVPWARRRVSAGLGRDTRQDAVAGECAEKAWPRARPRVPGEAAGVVLEEAVPAYACHAP